MAARKGNPQLSPADPAFAITSRPTTIVLNGGPPITLDMIDPSLTFDCVDGDVVTVVASDVNSVGTGPASDPFVITAGGGGLDLPPKPTVLGVVFTTVP